MATPGWIPKIELLIKKIQSLNSEKTRLQYKAETLKGSNDVYECIIALLVLLNVSKEEND